MGSLLLLGLPETFGNQHLATDIAYHHSIGKPGKHRTADTTGTTGITDTPGATGTPGVSSQY